MEEDQVLIGSASEGQDCARKPLKNKQGCLGCDYHDCMVCLAINQLDCETMCPCDDCKKK